MGGEDVAAAAHIPHHACPKSGGSRAAAGHMVELPRRERRRLCRGPGCARRGRQGVQGDEYEQAKAIFVKMRGLIEAAGGAMSDVVKVMIFVTDIKNREKVWKARREVFTGDFPVSTLVQVAALASPDIKVEIEAIAHLGAGAR